MVSGWVMQMAPYVAATGRPQHHQSKTLMPKFVAILLGLSPGWREYCAIGDKL